MLAGAVGQLEDQVTNYPKLGGLNPAPAWTANGTCPSGAPHTALLEEPEEQMLDSPGNTL
jgi:hypothetical protein